MHLIGRNSRIGDRNLADADLAPAHLWLTASRDLLARIDREGPWIRRRVHADRGDVAAIESVYVRHRGAVGPSADIDAIRINLAGRHFRRDEMIDRGRIDVFRRSSHRRRKLPVPVVPAETGRVAIGIEMRRIAAFGC